jgi:sulfur-carrier protein
MVTIKIPALWRPITHESQVTVPACTVIDAVHELATCFPKLNSQLFNDQKEVNDAIHLFVNGEAIRFRGGLSAPLQDGDEIYIVPMISGG